MCRWRCLARPLTAVGVARWHRVIRRSFLFAEGAHQVGRFGAGARFLPSIGEAREVSSGGGGAVGIKQQSPSKPDGGNTGARAVALDDSQHQQ